MTAAFLLLFMGSHYHRATLPPLGGRTGIACHGRLHNTNTREGFIAMDKAAAVQATVNDVKKTPTAQRRPTTHRLDFFW